MCKSIAQATLFRTDSLFRFSDWEEAKRALLEAGFVEPDVRDVDQTRVRPMRLEPLNTMAKPTAPSGVAQTVKAFCRQVAGREMPPRARAQGVGNATFRCLCPLRRSSRREGAG
jgi:hypothetical protein